MKLEARRTRCSLFLAAGVVATCMLATPGACVDAQGAIDPEYEAVREAAQIREHAGDAIPTDLSFRDHNGQLVKLSDFLDGNRPVILTLVYLDCPMMCGLVQDGLLDVAKRMKWDLGTEYRILTISFDPQDTPEKAASWRQKYLTAYARPGVEDWAFLTGQEDAIRRLASAVGFGYKWVESKKEFAHPAALTLLSPQGVISRYLHGITYDSDQLQLSLMDAADGKVGSFLDQVKFLCYRWDPVTGQWTATAMFFLRIFAAITVLGVALMIVLLRVREKRPSSSTEARVETSGLIGTRT